MLLVLGVVLILVVIWGAIGLLTKRGQVNDAAVKAVWGGGFLLVAYLLVVLIIYLNNGAYLSQWEVFYQVSAANYSAAVDRTEVLLSVEKFEGKLIAGSVERLEQAGYVSERLVEWRDMVNKYNRMIAAMRYIRGVWWLPGFLFMPHIPDTLVPLSIQ